MPESGQPIAAGTRLPSERELTAALEVSRTTVANACAVLLEHEFLTLGVPELRELVDVALGWTAPGWTRDRAVRWQRCSRRATSDLGAPVRAVGERLPDLRLLVPSGLSLWRERPEGVGATRVALAAEGEGDPGRHALDIVARVTPDQPAALIDLLATLDLEELGSAQVEVHPQATTGPLAEADAEPLPDTFAEDVTLFRGQSQKQLHGRVFGGQVLAQGVVAAGRTVLAIEGGAGRRLHSIHAYFMRPGDDTRPITFSVERMRDGRSFSTRRVHAVQHGQPILSMSASFQTPDDGLDHQDSMPAVAPPESVPSLAEVYSGVDHPAARHLVESRAIELRHLEGDLFGRAAEQRVADQRVWMRAIGSLPDDPLIHEAVLAYASDYSLLESALRAHGKFWRTPGLRAASLDHAMWFHRPARADDWILYAQHSPSAQGGRGLGIGRMFTRDGTLVATVAQEGMIRVPRTDPDA